MCTFNQNLLKEAPLMEENVYKSEQKKPEAAQNEQDQESWYAPW
jgi:hypothetical protein